jgi:Ca-activated chloride channel family protein
MTEALHWTRPEWLLGLPVGAALLWTWWRTHAGARLWRSLVDAELLRHLAGETPAARCALLVAMIVLALVCTALAGPVWRAPHEIPRSDSGARIVVLDLSPSMDAIDVAPSRLQRAREAGAALLNEAAGARLGVVVFGADAFSVAPLTSDAATLTHLLDGLTTATVPRAGERPDLALEMAHGLLRQAGVASGEVILVGDSAGDARTLGAARALADAGFPLSVLAVGTAHGGPVPVKGGAFAKTRSEEVLIVKPDLAALERVARSGGGRFQMFSQEGGAPRFGRKGSRELRAASAPSVPRDFGAWLVLIALPFAALLFRRGWLAWCILLAIALPAPPAEAFDWSDLWRRADQQAARAFARGEPAENARLAAKLGEESPWHAMLLYRSGQFGEAAATFAARDTADAHYNRGNALARDGELELALAAYDAALQRDPGMQDALFNRAIVREALTRRAQHPQDGDREDTRQRSRPAHPPGARGGRTLAPRDARELGSTEEPAGRTHDPAQPRRNDRDEAQKLPGDRAIERARLEELLAQVADDPGSLLANRFARQLRMRGVPHHDTGARW